MFSSRNNSDNLSQVTDELFKALSASSNEQVQGLQQTRDIQVNLSPLLQNEARRLERKYGAAHPRLSQINRQVQRNVSLVKDLEVELEIASIRQPDVDNRSALVQGRITDENNRGISELVAYLGSAQGQPLSFIENAETDRSGYYALPVSPEILKRIRESEPNGVFLGVCTRQGRQVYQQPKANLLEEGDRLTLEVTLSRTDLSPIDGGKPTSPTPPRRNDWTVRGHLIDANGAAVSGVQVNAIDINRRFDDKLGSDITDENGTFFITYRFGNLHDDLTEQRGPDLYVTVISEKGERLYSSQRNVRQNASRTEEFKITLGGTSPDTPNNPDTPNRPDIPSNPERPNTPLEGSVIWFETRSTRPRQDGQFAGERLLKLAIRRVQTFIRTNQDAQIALRGYASVEEGTRAEALSLSEKRAEVVKAQLIESGIPANRLTTTANGTSTIYPETTLNQRVEIVIPD